MEIETNPHLEETEKSQRAPRATPGRRHIEGTSPTPPDRFLGILFSTDSEVARRSSLKQKRAVVTEKVLWNGIRRNRPLASSLSLPAMPHTQ